ncbi:MULTISPECIES: LPS export ABC transporter permease LptG [Phenylobacterium]|uniref:Lipopolysaccharide export system permease protein n=1 Tax=Phenylobacterium koreense TaxID=266125 RepID=A0ABV2EK35_9CAUL
MIGLGKLERYVMSRMLTSVGSALAVIAAVIILVSFVNLSREVAVRADVGVAQLFALTLLQTPSIVLLLLPFVFLFGGMAAYVGLNRRSELVAMRAAGISAWRFILPSAMVAAVIGALVVLVFNPLAAAASARYESDRANLMENYLTDAPKEVWLRQGDDRTQMVIHARQRDTAEGRVRLKGVSLFVYQKNQQGRPEFKRRLEAAEAQLYPGYWKLTDVKEASAGESSVRSDSLSIRSSLDAESAMERFAAPESIAFWRLPAAIRLTEQAGFSANGYRLRFQQLLATPVLFAAMLILSAAFSLRLARLGGLAGLAGAGVGLGFVVFFFNEFSGALADADIIPLFAAAWAPPVVALLSGLALLCYTEDG